MGIPRKDLPKRVQDMLDNPTSRSVECRLETQTRTTNQAIIILRTPSKALSPNARVHWAVKSRATKEYRETAKLKAKEYPATYRGFPWPKATVKCEFYFRTKHRRDLDNLIASMKPAFDGLADAGIVANDSDFIPLPPTVLADKKFAEPFVVITIEKQEA